MKKSSLSVIVGILIIGFGIFYAGSLLGYWDLSIKFNGWWTIFIILPCLVSMGTSGINLFNTVGVGVGVLLLLNAQGVLENNLGPKLIAPYVVIVIGFAFIFRKPIMFNHSGNNGLYAASDGDNYYAVFGNSTPRLDGLEFRGANAFAIFGGICFKLKQSIIKRDCTICVYSIFGNTIIYPPSNVRLLVRSIPVFGSVSNKFNSSENGPTLYIRAISVFGTTDIH